MKRKRWTTDSVSYISEIMSSKSIASVKREVKAKESKQKKYNNLKKSHKEQGLTMN